MTLEDIARCCHIPISKLEALFFDGHLGTAAQHILYQCARCGVPMSTAQHRGRFCTACTGKVETEIRLTQPSRAVEVIEGEAVLAPEGTSSEALQKQQREQQKRTAEKIDEAKTILAEEMEQADKAMENDQRKTLAPQHFGFKRSS